MFLFPPGVLTGKTASNPGASAQIREKISDEKVIIVGSASDSADFETAKPTAGIVTCMNN